MCLAILKKPNANIPRNYLERGFAGNPHGAGFSYVKKGKLFIEKGFFTFDEFWAAYSENVTDDLLATVHFRLATHGARNAFNCHPFVIRETAAKEPTMSLIHNGIIGDFGNVMRDGQHVSDTAHFCIDFAKPLLSALPEKSLSFSSFRDARKAGFKYDNASRDFKIAYAVYLGLRGVSGLAKLCIISRTGDYIIVGENQGDWDNGVWYSNCGYKRQRFANSWPSDQEMAEMERGFAGLSDEDMEAIRRWENGDVAAG